MPARLQVKYDDGQSETLQLAIESIELPAREAAWPKPDAKQLAQLLHVLEQEVEQLRERSKDGKPRGTNGARGERAWLAQPLARAWRAHAPDSPAT